MKHNFWWIIVVALSVVSIVLMIFFFPVIASERIATIGTSEKITDYIDLVEIGSYSLESSNSRMDIFYDRNTDVMYFCLRNDYSTTTGSNGVSPIYNRNGSLKLYRTWGNGE